MQEIPETYLDLYSLNDEKEDIVLKLFYRTKIH